MFRVFGNSRNLARRKALAAANKEPRLEAKDYDAYVAQREKELFAGMRSAQLSTAFGTKEIAQDFARRSIESGDSTKVVVKHGHRIEYNKDGKLRTKTEWKEVWRLSASQ